MIVLKLMVGAWLLLLPLVFHFENKVAKAKKKHSAALSDIHISVYRFFYILYFLALWLSLMPCAL